MPMNNDRLHVYAHLGHEQVEGWLGFGALGMTSG